LFKILLLVPVTYSEDFYLLVILVSQRVVPQQLIISTVVASPRFSF